jgi:hypothetical protein
VSRTKRRKGRPTAPASPPALRLDRAFVLTAVIIGITYVLIVTAVQRLAGTVQAGLAGAVLTGIVATIFKSFERLRFVPDFDSRLVIVPQFNWSLYVAATLAFIGSQWCATAIMNLGASVVLGTEPAIAQRAMAFLASYVPQPAPGVYSFRLWPFIVVGGILRCVLHAGVGFALGRAKIARAYWYAIVSSSSALILIWAYGTAIYALAVIRVAGSEIPGIDSLLMLFYVAASFFGAQRGLAGKFSEKSDLRSFAGVA